LNAWNCLFDMSPFSSLLQIPKPSASPSSSSAAAPLTLSISCSPRIIVTVIIRVISKPRLFSNARLCWWCHRLLLMCVIISNLRCMLSLHGHRGVPELCVYGAIQEGLDTSPKCSGHHKPTKKWRTRKKRAEFRTMVLPLCPEEQMRIFRLGD